MGFFDSKGNDCWVCGRTTSNEGQFLSSDELQMIFKDLFEEFNASELKEHCLCQVCAGILKFTAQDSVAAKIKIAETSEKVKDKLGSAASALKSKLGRNE